MSDFRWWLLKFAVRLFLKGEGAKDKDWQVAAISVNWNMGNRSEERMVAYIQPKTGPWRVK